MKALLVWSDGFKMSSHMYEDLDGKDGVQRASEKMKKEYENRGPEPDETLSYCGKYEALWQAETQDACVWSVIPIKDEQPNEIKKQRVKYALIADLNHLLYKIRKPMPYIEPMEYISEVCDKIFTLQELGITDIITDFKKQFKKEIGKSLDPYLEYFSAEAKDVTEQFIHDTGCSLKGYELFKLEATQTVLKKTIVPRDDINPSQLIDDHTLGTWIQKNHPNAVIIEEFIG